MDSLSTRLNDSFLEIDGQFWSLNFGEWLSRAGASQRSPNARQQFSDCERFYDVVVRPRIQGNNLVVFRVADCHHDNGSFKGQSNLAAGLKSGHVRHVYIQENQIGTLTDDHFDGRLAVLRLDDVIALLESVARKTRRICG